MSKAPIKHTAATLRPLNPIHVLRCILKGEPGGINRAHTLSSLGGEKSFGFSPIEVSRAGASLRGKGCAWVSCEGRRVSGLVAARQRSRRQSWEVTHLFLDANGENQVPRLLDQVSRIAASNGGERIFFRVRRDDPLADMCRQSGFFPCVHEVLYKGMPPPRVNDDRRRDDLEPPHLRKLNPRSDDFGVFRLYNAATPSDVRQTTGMTFDQWAASRETCRGKCQEFVLEEDGAVKGWLRTIQTSSVGRMSVMVHPAHEAGTAAILDFGLDRLRGTKVVYCLVPEYQVGLQRLLTDRGFTPEADYVSLARSTVVRVKEGARARAPVVSS